MPYFVPSDPNDRHRTLIEAEEWKKDLERQRQKEKADNIWRLVNTILAAVAALAAIAGVVIQLVLRQ